MYLHENPAEMSQLVTAAAEHFSRAEAYIEKDYFATMVLREATARNPGFVFKGGTCLSKCYSAIDRFSEDVDLGMAEDRATEGMRKAMKRSVVETAEELGLSISNLDATRSRRESWQARSSGGNRGMCTTCANSKDAYRSMAILRCCLPR